MNVQIVRQRRGTGHYTSTAPLKQVVISIQKKIFMTKITLAFTLQ